MVNISKMARAAGIGSAVGATIGGIKESRDKDGDILGGIVGGAFVGSIGGAGVSLGKQMLQSKLTGKAYNQSVSDSVMAKAKNTYAKHGAPNPNKDLKVAEQVSKATAGNTAPIREFSDFELESAVADMDAMRGAYDAGYSYKEAGLGDYRDYMRRSKNVYRQDTYQQMYDHPGASFDSSDKNYVSGVKDAIRHRLNNKPVTKNIPIQTNNVPNKTIGNVVDDYYGPGTANDIGDALNDFKETKTFRKWYISDPYSDGEIGTDLEIRQRKSDGTFEARRHGFFADDPEYYSKPTKWEPYKFS